MNETHEKRTTQPFGTFFNLIYTVALLISRLLHPVSVKGLENLPRNGALLIANHSSNWDPILLATALPRDYRLRVMAKEELFHYPVVSWLIRVGGAFPVNRGGADIQAVKTAMQSIRDGQNLLIFPEGTRSRNGNQRGQFHSGSFRCATKSKCPIVPVALVDSFKVLDQKGSKPVTVQIHYLKPICWEEYGNLKTTELAALVKERIAQAIQAHTGTEA